MQEKLRETAVRLVKKTGLRHEHLDIPSYYLPFLFFDGGAAQAPVQCDFEITYRCNMFCDMCPQVAHRKAYLDGGQIRHPHTGQRRDELSTEELKTALSQLAAAGTRVVQFTGGEAFLRKDLCEILAHAKARGLEVTLISNGSLITPEIAAHLVQIGVDAITFSLDGPADLHNAIRHLPDGFARLATAVRLIRAEQAQQASQRPRLSVSAVVQNQNQFQLADIVDTAQSIGVGNVNFNFPFFTTPELEAATEACLGPTLTRGAKPEQQSALSAHLGLDAANVIRQLHEAQRRAAAHGMTTKLSPGLQDHEIPPYLSDPDYSVVQRCFYPWRTLRVNAWGDVYPCSIDTVLGNIREQDIISLWNGPRFRHFRRLLKQHGRFPQCSKCCVLTNRLWDRLPVGTTKS